MELTITLIKFALSVQIILTLILSLFLALKFAYKVSLYSTLDLFQKSIHIIFNLFSGPNRRLC